MDEVDLFLFIKRDDFKHQQYINPLHLHEPYFEIIAFDNNFIVEHSETSDNRPYTTKSTTEINTTSCTTNIEIQEPNEFLYDTSESQVQDTHQSPQRTPPITHHHLMHNLKICHSNQMKIITMIITKINFNSQILHLLLKVQISQLIQISLWPIRPIRPIENQVTSHNIEQDPQYLIQGASTLSTTTNTVPQPPISRNYDPPPLPESDTYTSSSISQQPSSFNNNINGLISNTRPRFSFQSPSPPERTFVTTHPYTQAQNTSDPNIPTSFNFNMLHTSPSPNIVTYRTLS